MVKVCPYNYPKEREEEYKKYYEKYPYNLHDFQKWSIEAIVTGNHVLITAPTGTGKTMPGEFALDYFHSKGKKTIYTSPIKALSNEKFYNFTKIRLFWSRMFITCYTLLYFIIDAFSQINIFIN